VLRFARGHASDTVSVDAFYGCAIVSAMTLVIVMMIDVV
jgi:hypothetical protein